MANPDPVQDPVAIIIGQVGAGKTTIFNKVCDAQGEADITDDSMVLYDVPGCNSKEGAYAHSFVLRHGLTCEPLSGVFVTLQYNPCRRNNMGEDFYSVAKILKKEAYDHIVVLVTKMDQFYPDSKFPDRKSMEQHILQSFQSDYGINRVVFSDKKSTPAELFLAMRKAIDQCSKIHLSYTVEEFLDRFESESKAWKGREQFDLHRLQKQIEKVCAEFEEGLQHLVATRQAVSSEEFQDYIYAIIQQSRMELEEKVYQPFLQRNGDDQVAFEDYAASIELKTLIHHAHSDLRDEAKKFLMVNPDNVNDWRNAIRRCQHCGEVWVKVEGCDGATQCGARPSGPDPTSKTYHRWERIEGKWRPGKFVMKPEESSQLPKATQTTAARGIGCGKAIVWKDQAVVPKSELDCLFSTHQLELILSSFKVDSTLQKPRKRNERGVQPLAESRCQNVSFWGGQGTWWLSDQLRRLRISDSSVWWFRYLEQHGAKAMMNNSVCTQDATLLGRSVHQPRCYTYRHLQRLQPQSVPKK